VIDVDQHRRTQPLAAVVEDLAAAEHARALGARIGELRGDDVGLLAEDEGPDGAGMDVRPVDLDGARLLVMDSASIGDTKTTPEIDAAFAEQLARLGEMAEPGSWLLTHKPLAGGILRLDRAEHYVSYATMRAISGNTLPDGIEVVVSGHIHLAEAVLYEQDLGRPVQLTSGNGGTLLDPGETAAFSGVLLENPEVDAGLIGASFGWMALVPDGDRLTVTALAADGGTVFTVHVPNPAAAALAPAATPVGG